MLNEKQKRFCDEYLVDLNATQAGIRAGYSKKTAYSSAQRMLKNVEIRACIEKKLEEAGMSKMEALKLVSDIARGNLGDYFVTKKVQRSSPVQKSLKTVIAEAEAARQFEIEFAEIAGYSTEEMQIHLADIAHRKREIDRMKLELKKNPKATRIVNGPPEIMEDVELDMAKLVADKERGRIKSISPTEHGLKVELYSADAALTNVLKVHGAFEKDNEQQKPIATPFTDDQVTKILESLRGAKK